MSLSPHQRGTINSISKQNVEAIGETMQHSGDLFYNVGAASLEQTHSSPEGLVDSSSEVRGVFKSDKGYPVRGNFQQSGPVKWVHQDPVQTSTWFQGLPNMNKWSQNFGPSLSAMDDPRAFHKSHEMEAIKLEKLSPGSSQSYTDTSHVPGPDWDHHTMAAMQHAQFQALQQGHRPADLQYQPQGMHHDMADSTLQPFQLAFGPAKQPQATGFQQVFQGTNASLNMNYNEKPKSQQQLLQLQQQQQQLHRQQQMQQMQQMRQLQQQQQQQHQMQQQQQRLHQIQLQQQYHQQKKRQEQQQQQMQLQQHASGFQHLESIEKQRVKQEIESQDLTSVQVKTESSQIQLTVPQHLVPLGSNYQESGPVEATPDLQETQNKHQVPPRRSRRLSKDGTSPQGDQPSKDKVSSQNGGVGGVPGPTMGVIQSTQRRRRASKEINLETLAQKASEMEFLPAKCEDITSGRPAGMVPLVIPVSVPVRRGQTQMEVQGRWAQTDNVRHPSEISQQQNQPDRKPSVIVARRHSLKNSASGSFIQGTGQEDKSRRRPRPEPLVIPQPCTFIAPSVYSSITPYQSNLRSPVRLPEHASIIPPYTPPPILSPVREGSGLYSVLFLSSMAAGSQVLPPPSTPRSATRSLLRTSSSDISPPALPLIGEATPVSLEPRINIGSQYQAEIPELRDQTLALKDQHKATLVWLPNSETDSTASQDTRFDDLMNLVCSSVMSGGGTNPELAMHCLHECRGDVMEALEMMLVKNPIFSRNHHLANYHYAGSDCWTVDEKRYFNKGISAYRKDFFMVQKLVRTKTVAQCVEFYYTYKKQAKVGRNGTSTYGPSDPEESFPVMNVKEEENYSNQQEGTQDHVDERLQDVTKTLQDNENKRADVAHVDQKNGPAVESSGLMPAAQPSFKTPSPAPPKPRSDNTGKKSRAATASKSQGEPEGIFPCKKCTRVFYKVKSRSAHMKSHSEQEKKAAALRQREEEERAAKEKQEMQEMLEAARRKEAQEIKQEETSGSEESPAEQDDEQDEDWH